MRSYYKTYCVHIATNFPEKCETCISGTNGPKLRQSLSDPFVSVDKPKAYFCPEHWYWGGRRSVQALIRQLNRARKAGVPATLTWSQWSKTTEDFDLRCAYCELRPYYVMEHFIPIEYGGGTTVENCIPACSWCNRRKGGKLPEECLLARWKVEKVRTYLAQRGSNRDSSCITVEEGEVLRWWLP